MKTLRFTNSSAELSFDVQAPVTIQGTSVTVKAFSVSPYKPRVGVQMKYGKSGGIASGDREVDARTISMTIDMTQEQSTSNDYNYIKAMDQILGFFRPEFAPFYLYDDQDDAGTAAYLPRRAKVELEEEGLTQQSNLERTYMSGMLKFTMLDGLWEDSVANTYDSGTGGIADGGTFSITNNSQFRSFPVYTLTALANNTLFRLTNQDTDVFIEVGSSAFTIGEDMVIDTNEGTITVGGVDISASALSEGSSFPDLIPGTNTFSYSSAFGGVQVSVEYREQYGR